MRGAQQTQVVGGAHLQSRAPSRSCTWGAAHASDPGQACRSPGSWRRCAPLTNKQRPSASGPCCTALVLQVQRTARTPASHLAIRRSQHAPCASASQAWCLLVLRLLSLAQHAAPVGAHFLQDHLSARVDQALGEVKEASSCQQQQRFPLHKPSTCHVIAGCFGRCGHGPCRRSRGPVRHAQALASKGAGCLLPQGRQQANSVWVCKAAWTSGEVAVVAQEVVFRPHRRQCLCPGCRSRANEAPCPRRNTRRSILSANGTLAIAQLATAPRAASAHQ
mmetsp:Transcript_5733/g.13471  ORF Transcript_5733/g.13471 Transcript_5733/m.13471 type:complete len:277 (-) Transcript_5733:1302-2132(-)